MADSQHQWNTSDKTRIIPDDDDDDDDDDDLFDSLSHEPQNNNSNDHPPREEDDPPCILSTQYQIQNRGFQPNDWYLDHSNELPTAHPQTAQPRLFGKHGIPSHREMAVSSSPPARTSVSTDQEERQEVPYVSMIGAFILSGIVTVVFCFVFGMVALVLAIMGRKAAVAGKVEEATSSRTGSYIVSVIGIFIGSILMAIYFYLKFRPEQ